LAETSLYSEKEGGFFWAAVAPIADLLTIYWVYRGRKKKRAILFAPYTIEPQKRSFEIFFLHL
jgi:hypothetical protein